MITDIASHLVKETSGTNALSSSVRIAVIGLMNILAAELALAIRVVLKDKTKRGTYDFIEGAMELRSEKIPRPHR